MASNSLRCDICNIDVTSDRVMTAHFNGKKHKKMSEFLKKKSEEASRSIYIQNPPAHCTQSLLESSFCQFGKVLSVFVDAKSKHFAIIEFQMKDSVKKVLDNRPIMLNGSELRVKQREVKMPAEKHNELELSKQLLKKQKEVNARNEAEHEKSLIEEWMHCVDLEDQVNRMVSSLELPHLESTKRRRILQDLEDLLTAVIPGCRVHAFGSSASDLATRGSDIDICVDLNLDKPSLHTVDSTDTTAMNFSNIITRDLGSLEVVDGRVSLESLKTLSQVEFIKLLSQLLKTAGRDVFHAVRPIVNARVPVIKALHTREMVPIDVVPNNRLALRNTHFIRLLLSCDDRVRPLVFTLRHWAKLRGVGGSHHHSYLTNYSLTMLVYRYLIQTNPPVLRTLHHLAHNTDNKVAIDGWDVSFGEDNSNILSEPHNTQPLAELIHGFFRYYADLDLSSLVVKVRDGTNVPSANFITEEVHSIHNSHFQVSHVNIQDPFVLDQNIGLNVSKEVAQRLQTELRSAATKCESQRFRSPCRDVLHRQTWGLAYLCSDEALVEKSHKLDLEGISINVNDLIQRVLREVLYMEVQVVAMDTEADQNWSNATNSSPSVSEEHGESDSNCDSRKRKHHDNKHHDNKHHDDKHHDDNSESSSKKQKRDDKPCDLHLRCVSHHRLWEARENVNRTPNCGRFDQEKAMSDHLMGSREDGALSEPDLFDLTLSQAGEALTITAHSYTNEKDVSPFFVYLSELVTEILDECRSDSKSCAV